MRRIGVQDRRQGQPTCVTRMIGHPTGILRASSEDGYNSEV